MWRRRLGIGENSQGTEQKLDRKRNLLHLAQIQPPDHVQRHVQNDYVKKKVQSCHGPGVDLEVQALIREHQFGIEGCLEGPTVKDIREEANDEPSYTRCPNDKAVYLEASGGEHAAVEDQE